MFTCVNLEVFSAFLARRELFVFYTAHIEAGIVLINLFEPWDTRQQETDGWYVVNAQTLY